MIDILILVLSFALIALVSGNNLAICTGPIISSRIVSRKTGIILAILGYSAGFLLQGSILRIGIMSLVPASSPTLLLIPLVIGIVIFTLAHIFRVPQPLSITFTMALVGISIAIGSALSTSFLLLIIGSWVLATVGSLAISYLVMGVVEKRLKKKKIWRTLSIIKISLIVLSFLAAFTFGANTLGIVYAVLQPSAYATAAIILAIIIGSIFLSTGELRRIGEEILPLRYANALVSQLIAVIFVEAATVFGIPLSNTQALTSSIYGAGMSYKSRLLEKKPLLKILTLWVIAAVASLVAGYLITLLVI